MDNLTLKSLFIFDPTLRPNLKKAIDDQVQDFKLLYYYPITENIHVKRSNSGK